LAYVPAAGFFANPAQSPQFYDASANLAATLTAMAGCDAKWPGYADLQRGDDWIRGSMAMSIINTVVTPNERNWTYCSGVGGSQATFSNAGSYHSGGVNTMMGDASVRFIKNGINRAIWMALGTKANGEVISADSY
jgi:hypothetical protein